MDPIKFIEKKKSGGVHEPGEIYEFISCLMAGEIPDYQVAAWLMAVNFQGLNPDETFALTKGTVDSGKTASYETFPGPVVDKHSTGGIGDKITLVLLPILAEMGMYIPKHSGRALGFTGGTIDKLESIPGFKAFLPEEKFANIVREVGFAIGGQSEDVCPADGVLYALRDATSTVDNLGLIAASVMSKKIAGGAEYILIDIKVGKGAFIKDVATAVELAGLMIDIGNRFDRKVRCLLTRMDEPLGRTVGNALEIFETVDSLTGNGEREIMEICRKSAALLGTMSGCYGSESDASEMFDEIISSRRGLERFRKFVSSQGGDVGWLEARDFGDMVRTNLIYEGEPMNVEAVDPLITGEFVRRLGGGRLAKDELIDHAVGVIFHKKVGADVKANDLLAEIYHRPDNDPDMLSSELLGAFRFSTEPVQPQNLIIRLI